MKPTILYALAAPSTPESVVDKAIEKAESGAKVTVADVKDWKAELDAERQARARDYFPRVILNRQNCIVTRRKATGCLPFQRCTILVIQDNVNNLEFLTLKASLMPAIRRSKIARSYRLKVAK